MQLVINLKFLEKVVVGNDCAVSRDRIPCISVIFFAIVNYSSRNGGRAESRRGKEAEGQVRAEFSEPKKGRCTETDRARKGKRQEGERGGEGGGEGARDARSQKREKGATRNKKSGSPLRSERLGAGGLEQVITSGCGGDAACAGPS